MWFKNRTLDDSITFTQSTTQSLRLPRDRFIRQIMIHGQFTNTVAAGAISYGFQKLFTKIRVVASGNDQLVSVEGYRLWVMNKYMHGCPLDFDHPINGDSSTTKDVYFMLHFAMNEKNPFDASALLPAHLLSSLDLYIDFGAVATYIGTTPTTTGTVYVTVTECYMDKNESDSLYGANLSGLLKRYESDQVYAISAAVSDYSQNIDVPVGNRILKMGIFTETSSAYSDAVISKYRLKQMSPVDMEIHHSAWKESQQEDLISYQLGTGKWTTVVGKSAVEVGFTMYDPMQKSTFLDTRGMKQGDLKLQFNTTPATGNVYLYTIRFL